MNNFSETWESMSVEQRAHHIAKDWQNCRESNDPMVMRVAAAVAHQVVSEAIAELSKLRAERDEARRLVCAHISSEQALIGMGQQTLEEVAATRGWDCFRP